MVGKTNLMAFFAILNFANALQNKGSGFKKVSVSCFDVSTSSPNFKTLIECCGFCLVTPNCEGVRVDGKNCTTLTNLTTCCPTINNNKKAWVETKTMEKLEIRKNSCKHFNLLKITFVFTLFHQLNYWL